MLGVACNALDDPQPQVNRAQYEPVFPEVEYPDDNGFTQARYDLGKMLFYDNLLSVDSSINCGSCHKPELAFSDDLALSPGVKARPGVRNALTLANVAFHPYYTREGGVPTLEMQVLIPIQEHNEFDFNIVAAGERLANDSTYVRLSQEAYGRDPDYFVITRALATFERSLISNNSRFDQSFKPGSGVELTALELAGMDLFYSERTSCGACHGGFNFTDYSFENNGLYSTYADIGRKRLTGLDQDEALFKVPTLRNIAITAPYMHDGSISTLEEVIEHYNSGGKGHSHQSNRVRPLNLSNTEKQQLLAFLVCLTDESFITNTNFK